MTNWKNIKKLFTGKDRGVNQPVKDENAMIVNNQQTDFSQFQGVWNAQRLIEYICQYKAMFGNEFSFDEDKRFHKDEDDYVERPLKKIMRERINAVIDAYDKFIFGKYFYGFIDEKCSCNKIYELEVLLKKILSPEEYSHWNIQTILKDCHSRAEMFRYILEYRTSLVKLKKHAKGILESNKALSVAIEVTEGLYNSKIEEVNNKSDYIPILLMDDDYEKTFSEKELIMKHNYPSITDEELQEMDLNWITG